MKTNKQQWGYGLPDQAYAPEAPAAVPTAGNWRHRFKHLRGDLSGGLVAAMLTIPVSIGHGLLALQPLGESAVPHAILAGLYAPVPGMNEEELASLSAMLTRQVYRKGDVVFRQGDTSRELYIIAKGSASARLRLPGNGRETRLITFAAGTVFGEIALLDQEARSATIEADDDLVCYVLDHAAFEILGREHPQAAIRILANLGRELGARLRRANRTIQELAS